MLLLIVMAGIWWANEDPSWGYGLLVFLALWYWALATRHLMSRIDVNRVVIYLLGLCLMFGVLAWTDAAVFMLLGGFFPQTFVLLGKL